MRDYVQDGLVAMWDGIENAGWGVHDPNATVWKDIISDKTLLLANGMLWTNNSLNTNGKHTAMGESSGIPMKINTIEIVFKNSVRLAEFVVEIRNSDTNGGGCGFNLQYGTLKPLCPYGNHFNTISVGTGAIHSCSGSQSSVSGTEYLVFDGTSYSYSSSDIYRPPYDYFIGNWGASTGFGYIHTRILKNAFRL